MDLVKVGQKAKGSLVTERDKAEAVVDESTHGADRGSLLASSKSPGGDEDAG